MVEKKEAIIYLKGEYLKKEANQALKELAGKNVQDRLTHFRTEMEG